MRYINKKLSPLHNKESFSFSRRAKILTAGIFYIFRGLKFKHNAENGQNTKLCKGLKFLVIILFVLLNTGCVLISDIGSNAPRIKDTADTLDRIEIGTSLEKIRDIYSDTVRIYYEPLQNLDANNVAMRMGSLCDDLVYYTYGDNFVDTYTFFRIHPIDLFLHLEEGDSYGMLDVVETNYDRADIYIFFSKDKKYKGYYATGLGFVYDLDSDEQLRDMEAKLIKAGYGRLCDYGKGKWKDWRHRHNKPLNLPPLKLPLIQHLNKRE